MNYKVLYVINHLISYKKIKNLKYIHNFKNIEYIA